MKTVKQGVETWSVVIVERPALVIHQRIEGRAPSHIEHSAALEEEISTTYLRNS